MPPNPDRDTAVMYANVLADQAKTYRLTLYAALTAYHALEQRHRASEARCDALRAELSRYTRAQVESAPGFEL